MASQGKTEDWEVDRSLKMGCTKANVRKNVGVYEARWGSPETEKGREGTDIIRGSYTANLEDDTLQSARTQRAQKARDLGYLKKTLRVFDILVFETCR